MLVFIIAAVLTPPDIISQFALAVPALLLYEAPIYSVRMVEKKREEPTRRDDGVTRRAVSQRGRGGA